MKTSTKNKFKLNLQLTKAVLTDRNPSHVHLLIKKGADPFCKDTHERTLLHQVRSERMIRLLIRLGLDINAKDRDGKTALECAINYDRRLDESYGSYPQFYLIEELLKHKPDIKEVYKSDRPLLYSAISSGCDIRTIFALIKYGVDVNVTTTDGNTALHYVVENGRTTLRFESLQLVQILLDNGANIYAANDIGVTPLILAAFHFPSATIIKEFMMFGNEIDLIFMGGYNVLQWIVLNSVCKPNDMRKILKLDFYQQLINSQSNHKHHSLLHLVCSDTKGNIKLAKLLIKFGADVKAQDVKLRTPLHKAVCNLLCDPKLIELLLDNGADINAKNFKGNTPLYCALNKDRIKYSVIKTLIFHGANIQVKNNNCATIFHRALKNPYLPENIFVELFKLIYENDIVDVLYKGMLHQNPLSLCVQQGKIKNAGILLNYMALKSFKRYKPLKLMKQFLLDELLKSNIEIREQLMYMFLECWEELKMMGRETISENVSLLRIISLNVSELKILNENKNIKHLMAAAISRLNSNDYSIYNDLMCLQKADLLHTLEEMQIYCKEKIGSHKIILDQLSFYHLIKFFSKQDLINIIIAFSDNLCAMNVPIMKSSKIEKVNGNTVDTTIFVKEAESFIRCALRLHNFKINCL